MDVSELDYHLPPELIATRPAHPRDSARMLVCSRSDPSRIEHTTVARLADYLSPSDVMVRNITRVLPARFMGVKQGTGGRVEGLFLVEQDHGVWRVMLKSSSALRPDVVIDLHDARAPEPFGARTGYAMRLLDRAGSEWHVQVVHDRGEVVGAAAVLEALGATPLPPYILRARAQRGDMADDAADRAWYQTVFAQPAQNAETPSVAAPTAGLHFTEELLARIRARGVTIADVELGVGVGTFKPIETDTLEAHRMHAERYVVEGRTLAALEAARRAGGIRLAIGTTTVRCLEGMPADGPWPERLTGQTELFIRPGFSFRWTEALFTNFHLPRSTLMALVGALFPGGVARVRELYGIAVQEGYRFYSYGDAMLVLP